MVLQEHAELIRSFGGAINEISYIRYSALRAFLIMEETYPRIVSWAKFLCLIIGGIFIIAMDLIFVVTFIKYTGQTHLVSDTPDERFLIIIRYGIASVVLSASGLLCGCLYAMTAVQYWESGALAQFNILGLCLFLMKVDLHKEKLRKEKERESRIYKVKNSATSTKSSSSEDRVSICTIDARKNMETSPLKGHLRSLDRAGAK
ncbi:hypothetical protein BDR26DRAFT_937109 [Obelidium mucronatum]|nr:hypothetical protein BDR26DRAFT_937109 [Obelidium mucronatum]